MSNCCKPHNTSEHNKSQHIFIPAINPETAMERIVLVGFLADNNGHSCELYPFGCGNSLVVNRDDGGVGLRLCLRSFMEHELACYTINPDGSDGCCVGFAAREYAAGENDLCLDGMIVLLVEVFTADHDNRSMHRLFHHNRGYAYADVFCMAIVSFSSNKCKFFIKFYFYFYLHFDLIVRF